MKQGNLVKPEHLERFDYWIAHWQRELNLLDWRIVRGPKQIKNAMSDVTCSPADKLAVYRIGTDFGFTPVTEQSISATVCHELCHVLLADYKNALEAKATDDLVMAAEHRIVHTLERRLVPPAQT